MPGWCHAHPGRSWFFLVRPSRDRRSSHAHVRRNAARARTCRGGVVSTSIRRIQSLKGNHRRPLWGNSRRKARSSASGAKWQRLAEGGGGFQVRNNIRADTAPAGRFGCYRTPSGHSLTVTQYREKWSCRPALRHPSLNAIVVTPAACRGHAPRRCCAEFHSSRRRSCRKKHSRNRTLGCRKALPRAWRIPGLRPRRSGP
jgi:hypothetical protein